MITPAALTMDRVVGEGAFGTVWRAEYQTPKGSKAIVAVAGTSSSSDELSKPSGAAALPSGCFKPPSLDVNNAMQLA